MDEKGISNAIVAIILVAISLVLVGSIVAYTNMFKPSETISAASISITDDPTPLSANMYFVDIQLVSGKPIPVDALKLNVYRVGKNGLTFVYSKRMVDDAGNFVITDSQQSKEVQINQKSDGMFDPGDIIKVKTNILGGNKVAGLYKIQLVDAQSNSVIAEAEVQVQ